MGSHEIEAVAQAFYEVMDGARGWQREPERLRARFRADARAAIAALDERRSACGARAGDGTLPSHSVAGEKKAK